MRQKHLEFSKNHFVSVSSWVPAFAGMTRVDYLTGRTEGPYYPGKFHGAYSIDF
jgi:hypothetical protein